MTLLQDVVAVAKFKKLANELTDPEFKQFLFKISEKYEKETILKLFVSGIIKPISIDNHHIMLANMTGIVSDIIQTRKSKDIQQTNTIQLDQITSSLIGEIGSYLDQKSYSLFTCANRTVLVSLNQPNRLQMLCLKSHQDLPCIRLQNHPQIKVLWVRLAQFKQFKLPQNQTICNELRTIVFWPNVHNGDSDIDEISMQQFIDQNCINLNHVQTLCIGNARDPMVFSPQNADRLYRLLSRFPRIECLALTHVYVDFEANYDFRELFPDLKTLSLLCVSQSDWMSQLLHQCGSNLECLSLTGSAFSVDDINWRNLDTLCCITPTADTVDTINGIMKTAKSIKELVFFVHDNHDEFKGFIKTVIKEQHALQRLVLHTPQNNWSLICSALESALFSDRKQERDVFEILISFRKNPQKSNSNVEDVTLNISKIVNQLIASNIRNFTLECRWYANVQCTDLKLILETTQELIQGNPSITWFSKGKREFVLQKKKYQMRKHSKWPQCLQYVK